MSYILNKTSGTVLLTVQDATIDQSTSLTFVGRNYAGYGEYLEENFVKILENFNNSTAPVNPVQGQLWFNSSPEQNQLNVYDGNRFKGVGSITVGTYTNIVNTSSGDVFWSGGTLYGYDPQEGVVLIGPSAGNNFSNWKFGREAPTSGTPVPVIRGYCGTLPVVTVSNQTFSPPNYNPHT